MKPRNYLTENEVKRMIATVDGRHKDRDQALIMLAFRHGLRATEATEMRWDQVNLADATLHVTRIKGGTSTVQYLSGKEVRMLRRLKQNQLPGAFVFVSQKGGPLTRQAFWEIIKKSGVAANIEVPTHPHMLRHACGHHLANEGKDTRSLQDYLGHKNIQHTVRYTQMAPNRFKDFWPD